MNTGYEGAPLEWLVFYSDKAGREYYYEPKSKLVTWILPDDAHPSGTTNSSQRRKSVTFHDSVATTILVPKNENENDHDDDDDDDHDIVDDEDVEVEPKNTNQWIAPLLLLMLIASTLVMYSFVRTKAKTVVQQNSIIAHDMVLEESPPTRIDIEEQKSLDRSIVALPLNTFSNPVSEQQIRLEWDRMKEQMESLLEDHDDQTIIHQSPPVHMEDPVAFIHDVDVVDDNTGIRGDESEQKVKVLERAIHHEGTRDHTSEQDLEEIGEAFHSQPKRVDKGCLIPLSHLFSKRCRALAKERPLVDISAFLDGMMQ